MLEGAKTYIVAGIVLVAGIVKAKGWIDESTFQVVLTVLGAMGLAALRAGVAKSGPQG